MTQKISSSNIETATLASFSGPTIANVSIANSTYTLLDDTAVSNAGGYVVITGTNFTSGAQVLFGSTSATSVTFVDSTQLNVQVPALTAGSYVVYIQNGDGSTAVRLNGITSSPIPVWSTGSTLTQQDSGTPISISLSATSDSNVTYSVANGSSLPSGTTLAANGLFSGTVTIENDTTYNFSVNAIDAENQETLRSFSVTVNAGDLFYYLTTLHLTGEAPANNWLTDTSTNKFALTVTADTRPVAFSPYETVWSNFFDGNDTLTTPSNSAFTYGTSDFTVEGWFYFTGGVGASGYSYLFAQGAGTGATSLGVYIQSGVFLVWNGSAVISSTTPFAQNIWTHIAVSRAGTSMRLFVNGNLEGTVTNSSNIATGSTTGISIGRWSEIGDGNYITGYVSNFRSVKGTALYTSNFTPPTSPLTAVSGTSLLTCQSNRLIDNSTNNFSLSRNGDVTVTNFGPFTETDLVTGSAYFDGSGDFLTAPSNTVFDFGTGDFTIECWIYPITLSNAPAVIAKATSAGSLVGWFVEVGTNVVYFGAGTNSGQFGTFSVTLPINTWSHIACTRSAGVLNCFVNGVSPGSQSSSLTGSYDNSNVLQIGRGFGSAAYDFSGYISNVRIIKGTVAYTGNFTPPVNTLVLTGSSPYSNTSNVNTTFSSANTSLLTLQSRTGENNNRFVDTSGINSIVTRNGNVTQGTFSPFSQTGWSNYFDGTGDYLSIAPNALNDLSGDFTVEAWIYRTVIGTTHSIFDLGDYIGASGILFYVTSGNALAIFTNNGLAMSGGIIPATTWTHVALVRSGSGSGNTRLYLNGVSVGTPATSTATFSGSLLVGADLYNAAIQTNFMNGYISNLRVLKGTALYTSNFTPPTTQLTAIANTSLLTCQSNRFIDNSTNNFTLTKNGDVSVQVFSPIKPSTDYSIANVGGSMYFDGTGDYLLVPDNAALESFNDFTVEFWVYFNSVSGTQVILDKGWNNGGGYSPYFILLSGGNLLAYASSSGTVNDVLSGASFGAMVAGQWYHIALTRSGSSIRLFTNGVVITSATNSSTLMSNSTNLGIGSVPLTGALLLNGYLSNLRIIKGAAAYTANTSPPTSPVLPVAGTTLLLNGTNGGIIDSTSRNNLETVGNVQLNNSIVKYGNTSMYFDGSGDFIQSFTSNQSLAFRTGDFTVECWVNFNASGQHGICQISTNPGGFNASNGNSIAIQRSATGQWEIYAKNSNPQVNATINQNQWYHVAIVRSGTTTKFYVDGTALITVTSDTTDYTGTYIGLGAIYSTAVPLNGYIDDLRITKGYARYTSNFTPPASAFKTK
jgi:hypothetical protein